MRLQYALVTFLFALSSAQRIAGRDGLRIRQDDNDAAITSVAPTSSTNSEQNPSSSPTPTDSASRTSSHQDQGTKTASPTGDVASPITRTGTAADVPTSTATSLPGSKNATSADGDNPLPLIPKINPPLGIAGVLLMLAGLALCFVGIKHRQTQIFLSTALLAGLAIEVLIVYLMKPPVPVGIQGAYLTAGVIGGLLVAAAALIFQEVSEGFGCILGGFCFAMWFLVLAPGGLIKNSVGKIILIASFCVACYCFYISRFCRVYTIIFGTALAGSTAFVLGLDCFTRAGLKEFWLYIWNLNDDVFPISTDTYPITRPIRAEVAAIIIIAFLGAMSQVKIWQIVKKQRQKRDAQRVQDEEARDALEEEVGRRVEHENRHVLSEWEHNYDGKKMPDVQIHESAVESIDDDYNSTTTSNRRRSYPLVQIRPATSEQNLATVHQSSSTIDLLPQTNLKTVPSLPELNFNFDAPYYNETTGKTAYVSGNVAQTPPEPSTPATPGLDVPGESIKDRRNVAMKRLSLQSLTEKTRLEAVEDEQAGTTPEEESEVGWSDVATAPEGKSDKLSIQLDYDTYQHWNSDPESAPEPSPVLPEASPVLPNSVPLVEGDTDLSGPRKRRSVLSLLSSNSRRLSSSSRRVSDAPLTPSVEEKKSDAGTSAGVVEPEVDLIERLPKKARRHERRYRVINWAQEVSRAEHEPVMELNLNDPDAVRVEVGDAAEAARAEENNAGPAPPKPPTPPPQPKLVVAKDSKLSTLVERSSVAMPPPLDSHKSNVSEDSWAVPLGKRSSSAQLLPAEPGSAPLDVMRNVSAPILEQPLSTSPVASLGASPEPRAPSRSNRLSALPSLPNLMDERRERLDKRLTSTSFMRPSTGLGINTPPKTVSNDSKDGSHEGSERGKVSISVDSAQDDEDMTLAARKALVQRQSQLQLQNTGVASRPMNARHASGYGFPEVKPPKPVRMSSQGQMQPLYDSHQPRRMSSHDVSKQAQNWNQWRTSQQIASSSRNPYLIGDTQQDMLRAMRIQTEHEAKLREQQKQAIQEQMNAHARMGGLNDAHQKALAKMQKKANSNLQAGNDR